MTKSVFIIILTLLSFILIHESIFAQIISKPSYCLEFHFASQTSFGPSESQAEIVGEIDSMSYDNKKHFIPGFKSNNVAELTVGYHKNIFQFQSTISYYKKDIGIVQKSSSNEYPFVLSKMLSIKASALIHLTNKENPKPYGFFTGFFIGSTMPLSDKINDQTKLIFMFKELKNTAQFCWGVDFNYSIRFAKKGWYAIAGMSGTLPGLVGEIGKIEMQPGSSYSITKNQIKIYSINGFLGIGKCFEN